MPRSNRVIADIHDLPRHHMCPNDLGMHIPAGQPMIKEGYVYQCTASLSGEAVEYDVRRIVEVCNDGRGGYHVTIHGTKTYTSRKKEV